MEQMVQVMKKALPVVIMEVTLAQDLEETKKAIPEAATAVIQAQDREKEALVAAMVAPVKAAVKLPKHLI